MIETETLRICRKAITLLLTLSMVAAQAVCAEQTGYYQRSQPLIRAQLVPLEEAKTLFIQQLASGEENLAAVEEIPGIEYDRGMIILKFGDSTDPSLRGKQIAVAPYALNGTPGMLDLHGWQCGYAPLPPEMGRTALGNPAESTTVPERQLPPECRAEGGSDTASMAMASSNDPLLWVAEAVLVAREPFDSFASAVSRGPPVKRVAREPFSTIVSAVKRGWPAKDAGVEYTYEYGQVITRFGAAAPLELRSRQVAQHFYIPLEGDEIFLFCGSLTAEEGWDRPAILLWPTDLRKATTVDAQHRPYNLEQNYSVCPDEAMRPFDCELAAHAVRMAYILASDDAARPEARERPFAQQMRNRIQQFCPGTKLQARAANHWRITTDGASKDLVKCTEDGQRRWLAVDITDSVPHACANDYSAASAAVREKIAFLGGSKTAVTEFFYSEGRLPTPEEFASQLQQDDLFYENGVVAIKFGPDASEKLRGRQVALALLTDGSSVSWQCGFGAVPEGFRPAGASAASATTVPVEALPDWCRPGISK